MNGIFKKIWDGITTVLVVIAVVLAVLLVGVRAAGLQVYTVLSGSMEPTYHTGALIYVKKIDPAELKVGDPATFVLDESLSVATHRVIEIDEENQCFYTKGDANDAADGAPVHFNNLIGKPVFTIPKLGYFADYIQKPPGVYVAIAAGAVILLMVFLPDLFEEEEKKGKKKKRRKRSGHKSGSKKGKEQSKEAAFIKNQKNLKEELRNEEN